MALPKKKGKSVYGFFVSVNNFVGSIQHPSFSISPSLPIFLWASTHPLFFLACLYSALYAFVAHPQSFCCCCCCYYLYTALCPLFFAPAFFFYFPAPASHFFLLLFWVFACLPVCLYVYMKEWMDRWKGQTMEHIVYLFSLSACCLWLYYFNWARSTDHPPHTYPPPSMAVVLYFVCVFVGPSFFTPRMRLPLKSRQPHPYFPIPTSFSQLSFSISTHVQVLMDDLTKGRYLTQRPEKEQEKKTENSYSDR